MTSPATPHPIAIANNDLSAVVLAHGGRHGAGALSASVTFAWRAVLKVKHVPEQVADVMGIPILSTVMFTYLFGGALGGSTRQYLQFLLPGTLVLAVVFITVYSGVTLNQDSSSGAFDRFRSLAIWRPAPLFGGALGDIGRYLIAAILVIALGLIMGFRAAGGVAGVAAAVGLILVFAFGVSWIWTTVGLLMRTPNAVMSTGFTLMFAFTFISNIFVDPRTMPGWLRPVVDGNPVSHLVTAVRGLMYGTAMASELPWVFGSAVVLTVIFAPITIHLYSTKH